MKTAQQRGGFAMGLVAGLLVGLAVALAVALYITKAPNPFVNKVPNRTAEQDTAEAERNRTWDPNAPLGGKAAQGQTAAGVVVAAPAPASASAPAGATALVPAPAAAPAPVPVAAAASAAAPVVPGARPAGRDPAAILAGGTGPAADPFVYFVQAGAYARTEEAEQQRARLALMGLTARITEREQAGRVMHRVRVGPFSTRDEADSLQAKLQEQTIEAQIVRVEKP